MHLAHCYALLAAAALHAVAQEYSSSSTPSTSTSTATPAQGEITIHTVTVGKTTNQYDPISLIATPGDIVSFEFFPSNHSVIRAQYGYPCVPYEDITGLSGFHSGFKPTNATGVNNPTWNLTINDTSPVFYYCGAPGSCIGWGMVGVINPSPNTPLDTQIELAKQADYMLEPGQQIPADALASMQSLAATATTVTLTVTATNSWEPSYTSSTTSTTSSVVPSVTAASVSSSSSGHLSSGAIAGIAVGAAAFAVIAAGLFYILGRQKSMRDEINRLHSERAPEMTNAGAGGPAPGGMGPGGYAAVPTSAAAVGGAPAPPYQSPPSPWHDQNKPQTTSVVMDEGWMRGAGAAEAGGEQYRHSHLSGSTVQAPSSQAYPSPSPIHELFSPERGTEMRGYRGT